MPDKLPKFTVCYNIANNSKWVGTGWEFFDDEQSATDCCKGLNDEGHCATMRPFHENDIPHLGAAHRSGLVSPPGNTPT